MATDFRYRLPNGWPHGSLSRFVSVGDLTWHVQVGGEGPIILLLHGTGASAHSFSDVMPTLMQCARVVVPDLPGHGFTSGASIASLTLPRIAVAIEALLESLSIGQVDVVAGHSAGVPLAMRWALSTTRAPQALVGFNPALIAPPTGYTDLIAPLITPLATSRPVASLMAGIAPLFGMVNRLLDSTGSAVPEAQRARYRTLFAMPSHVRGAMGLMAAADLPALLLEAQALKLALHFVLGDRDTWIPARRLVDIINKNFPAATKAIWHGGHLLHEVEPERAAQLLIKVMNEVRASVSVP